MVRDRKLISGLSAFFPLLLCLSLVAPGAELPPDAAVTSTCVGCHEGMDTLLAKTPHRILVSPDGKRIRNSPLGCGDCHTGWEKHLEEPDVGTIDNPKKIGSFENLTLCTSCHVTPHTQELPEFDVHFRSQVGCTDCHTVHQPGAEHSLVMPSTALCLGCHQEIQTQLSSVSHHPVSEKVIKCVDCHKAWGEPGGTFSLAVPNRECFACHSEFEGPFPFEHEALNDYTVEKDGCLVCHSAHGSPNPRLLRQPAKQLCLQCHFVPKHRTAHQGVWAKRDCLECHVDVHGSYTDKNLLGEDIFGGSCFVHGCHVH